MLILKILGVILAPIVLAALFVIICSLFVDPRREYEDHSSFYRALVNVSAPIALWIMGVRIHVTGLEKIPADTNRLLFVGNHRSNFDPIIALHVLRRWKPAFISKPENFDLFVYGRIARRCCFMAIDRENPRNALKTISQAAALLKKGEVSMGVYPEGTRSKNGELLPFHNGVFKIAQRSDSSIVVTALANTDKVHKNFPFRRTHVYFDVLTVIPPDAVKAAKTEAIGDEVRALLEASLAARAEKT